MFQLCSQVTETGAFRDLLAGWNVFFLMLCRWWRFSVNSFIIILHADIVSLKFIVLINAGCKTFWINNAKCDEISSFKTNLSPTSQQKKRVVAGIKNKNQTISIMSSSIRCQQEENFTHFSNYHFNLKTKHLIKKLGVLRFLFLRKELSDKN